MGTVRAAFQRVRGVHIKTNKQKNQKNLTLTVAEVIKDTASALDGIQISLTC